MRLYRTVARDIGAMIRSGTLKPGEQLPSVRRLCAARGISPATVLHAYNALESDGLVESRPRSGYYVRSRPEPLPPRPSLPKPSSVRLKVSDLVFQTLEASRNRETVPLGSAFPSPALFPWPALARHLGRSARHMDPWSTVESLPPGSIALRREIARRYLKLGITVNVDEIVITAGALEALNLSLQVVTRPGDTIAVESPTFYGCLQAVEWRGLNVVEIPTDPTRGVNLDALAEAIAKHPIRACWLMTTLHHPTGATLSAARKRELARLLASKEIALIEDDAYGELQFSETPAVPAKAYDRAGLVLHCGSFSKCLAPGYRLGWVAAGRFAAEVARRKIETSIATSLPVQEGIADFMRHGGYDAHLQKLRRALGVQQFAALASLERHFPPGYRVTRPAGGYFLWIECASGVDSLAIHQAALGYGITVAPGPIFSARQQFRNHLRINCGHPWTQTMDRAVQRIADLLRRH